MNGRPWWRIVALGAVLLIHVGSGLSVPPAGCGARMDVCATILRTGRSRPGNARLAGALPHQPPPVLAAVPTLNRRLWQQRLEAQVRASDPLDVPLRASLGAAHALLGDWDGAVALLDPVARAVGPRVEWLTDLSAAYLERAARDDAVADLVQGLDVAERAARRAPSLLEAWFNRALAMESLQLPGACQAWEEYLKRDPVGAFADEARRRARMPCLPRGHTRAARLVGVELADLTPYIAWARAPDVDVARASIAAAERVADRAAEVGDCFHADALKGISLSLSDVRVDRLRRAFVALQRGLVFWGKDDFGEAVQVLQQARTQLPPQHPFRLLIDLRLALASYYQGAYPEARERLSAVMAVAQTRGYRALEARVGRALGVTLATEGRFEAALEQYARAQESYARLGAMADAAFLGVHEAEVLDYLGEHRRGWYVRGRALSAAAALPDQTDRQTLFTAAALAALEQGLPDAALLLQREASALADAHGLRADQAELFALEARIEVALGRADEARRLLERASIAARAIADPALRARNQAEIALVRVALGDADVSELHQAMKYFETGQALARLTDVYAARASMREWRRERHLARTELLEATRVFGLRARYLSDVERRLTHGAVGRPLYERLVAMDLADEGAPWRALHALERMRRRLTSHTPLDLASFTARAQASAQTSGVPLFAFAVLPERLVCWYLASDGRLAIVQHPIARSDLGLLVDTFVDAARQENGPVVARIGRQLAQLLLPAEWSLPPRLRIVPDGPLGRLPFALLPTAGGEALFSSTILEVRPTVVDDADQSPVRRISRRALVVGDAAGSATALPGARNEALLVSQLYPNAQVLTGAKATHEALLAALPSADLLHFAGHAIVNRDRPLLSRLVLARGPPGAPPNLVAAEIHRLDLRGVRLAVLAACEAADGAVPGGDGVVSLASVLIEAGVHQVVASVYPLEDHAAARFFSAFHAAFARSGDAAASVALAQREMSRARPSIPARDWAGVISIVASRVGEGAARSAP